jgi:hypothetical protein
MVELYFKYTKYNNIIKLVKMYSIESSSMRNGVPIIEFVGDKLTVILGNFKSYVEYGHQINSTCYEFNLYLDGVVILHFGFDGGWYVIGAESDSRSEMNIGSGFITYMNEDETLATIGNIVNLTKLFTITGRKPNGVDIRFTNDLLPELLHIVNDYVEDPYPLFLTYMGFPLLTLTIQDGVMYCERGEVRTLDGTLIVQAFDGVWYLKFDELLAYWCIDRPLDDLNMIHTEYDLYGNYLTEFMIDTSSEIWYPVAGSDVVRDAVCDAVRDAVVWSCVSGVVSDVVNEVVSGVA